MTSLIFLDSFSGSIADLTAKQTKDEMTVLAVLAKDSMVSTFDMGEKNLWRTVDKLVKKGLVSASILPYPWHRYVLTYAGQKALKEGKI